MDNSNSERYKKRRGRPRRRGGRSATATGGPRGSGTNSTKSAPSAPPPPPVAQLKVTFRNITSVDRYGSCSLMATLLRGIIEKTNEKATSNSIANKIQLDEASISRAIMEEETVREAKRAFAESQEKSQESKEDIISNRSGESADTSGNGGAGRSKDETVIGSIDAETASCDLVDPAPKTSAVTVETPSSPAVASSAAALISARVLYMVPPKKTRRRGEKPGCMHLILQAPLVVTTEASSIKASSKSESLAGMTVSSSASPVDDSSSISPLPPIPPYTGATGVFPVMMTSSTSSSTLAREIAKRRLVLSRLVETMSSIALEDAKSSQVYAGVVVEESLNGKSWKPPPPPNSANGKKLVVDRLENTIWDTADYKSFAETQTRLKEERLARPKPPPGGAKSGTMENNTTQGTSGTAASTSNLQQQQQQQQPVAAIVQHLLAKQEAQKRRKTARRKQQSVENKKKKKTTTRSNKSKKNKSTSASLVAASSSAGGSSKGAAGNNSAKKN